MKKIIFLLITIISIQNTFAQTGKQKELRKEMDEFFWGKNAPYTDVVDIPEKYKNESAVIIYKYQDYDYHNQKVKVEFTEKKRLRIKIQDQNAILKFSDYEYNKRRENYKFDETVFGIKVIKPNGKETIIDVDKESIDIDDHKKIAIPGLEIGDILDMYQYSEKQYIMYFGAGFERIESTLGSEYPIMNYKMIFQTENDFFINYHAYNGAPELKPVPTEKNNKRKYEFTASDLPKEDFPRWFYPLVEKPCYKFQVYFARKAYNEEMARAYISEDEKIIKSKVTSEDIYTFYDKRVDIWSKGYFDDVEKFLEGKKFNTDTEKIREIYNFTRHQYYTRYIVPFILYERNISYYPFDYLEKDYLYLRNYYQFVNYFGVILEKLNIKSELIIGTGRENGPIEDLLLSDNVDLLLKINTEKPIYIKQFENFLLTDVIPYSFEGNTAYAIPIEDGKLSDQVKIITLPVSKFTDIVNADFTKIQINPDFESFAINRVTSITGHNKEIENWDKVFINDIYNEDRIKYKTTDYFELIKNDKRKKEFKAEYESYLKTKQADFDEKIKTEIEGEYMGHIENLEYKLLNSGRFEQNDTLQYREMFTLKGNYLKKAGNNYTFDIGKFLTSQLEIKEDEYIRDYNIYQNHPRSYKTHLEFEIPSGYSVTGLDKLNKNIKNETGAFVSTAEIKGNLLVIHTSKEYYNYFEPKENWLKMVEFLDAAYQFTQEKILLKKN
jgi:hypothetical protein